jgi:hypothetical protein
MTRAQELELGETVLRTRRWAFRDALPEILAEVRRIVAAGEERHRGANRMIDDYRRIIRGSTSKFPNSAKLPKRGKRPRRINE